MSSAANMIKVKNTIVQVVSQPEKSTSGVRSQIYTFMAKGLSNCMGKDWLTDAILASGTDNYPEESILNTLELSDRVRRGVSYWSSRGETDPTVPETLSYKLISNLCLVSEIHVIHFKLLKDLCWTKSHGHIPHQNFPWLRRTTCRSLGCQNLFFPLVESYKWSSYAEFKDKKWMVYIIYE
ncbi:PREDICTED: uncharacterized protein LOC109228862 isoform X4 [Nicotiana attenuata]|uniref:uncharacterized protein LOC109228862 isoform X4 n=1 Tax=Nicotiana attenuata TaxID=49451 RepID=UPI000904CFBC|nr:PREDICTED: uncharacterized protein LOC109228862 isoform X4 [Nicotiana attenuata]